MSEDKEVPASPKATPPPPAVPIPAPRPPGWFGCGQVLIPLGIGTCLLLGVLHGGKWLSNYFRKHQTFTITFSKIQCDPPPGTTREDFLLDVQYLSDFPDNIDLLEPGIEQRLSAVLKKHPWVARVIHVKIGPGTAIQVLIDYRKPVLAIQKPPRVVDAQAVILPSSAPRKGLPVFYGEPEAPRGNVGQPWGSPALLQAAEVADFLLSAGPMNLEDCRIEVTREEVVLHWKGKRILWGNPPGREKQGEATAEVKRKNLGKVDQIKKTVWDLRKAP